ncbi:MAG: TCP-1/cpn60 chaperonin family protein [Candidatus Aenigmarchaeota archaeon]|nr:TCP-1/cpn60 chaperonin family protein [Candidatus Aenigmarchaeota archaeon]
MAGMTGQPIFILPEGTFRSKGKDAQRNNIAAARLVADAVRTTLGPKGMDKMLVDSIGDVVITNDGATILEEMKIEHPAAKMMVEVAKTQDKNVGDGTTTAVVFAGELLKKAEDLLDQEIHPTVITKGFRLAKERALEILQKNAIPVTINDLALLEQIAITAMTGKSAERASQYLAKIAVQAIKRVANPDGTVDADNVKLEKKASGSMEDSQLIEGVVVDKEVVHPGMPKKVENARIALLDCALEVKELEGDHKISIDSPEKMQAFINEEERLLKGMVEKVKASGANVVLCQKGIDDTVQHYLAKAGVLAARRVKKSDMDLLTKATGGMVVSSIQELSKEDLGFAGHVEERKVAGEAMVFIERCKTPKAVTILLRGGTEHVVDEVERAMEDAVKGIAASLELKKIVPGGGAAEIMLAREIRTYADSFKGREQLAILAFADAMEIIPRSLAENAGLDPIDKLAALRAAHEKNDVRIGLNVFTGEVQDSVKAGVIEALKIKLQAVQSASEATEMILRIDDVISGAGAKPSGPPGGHGGMPPGMGGDMGDF